jgi:TPP-dependent pyruvate/acetoin dehydrogenase alpha subunit
MTTKKRLPREELIEFLGGMLLIRRFEEKVIERFRAGEARRLPPRCDRLGGTRN